MRWYTSCRQRVGRPRQGITPRTANFGPRGRRAGELVSGEHCEQPPQLGTRLLCASRGGPGGCPGPRPSRLESSCPVLEATRIRFDSRHALFCVSAFPCRVSSAAAVVLILRADAHGSPHPKLRRRSPVAMSYSVCASLALGSAWLGRRDWNASYCACRRKWDGRSLRIGETRRGGGARCGAAAASPTTRPPTSPPSPVCPVERIHTRVKKLSKIELSASSPPCLPDPRATL